MTSLRTLCLSLLWLSATISISASAFAQGWGYRDHRTYQGGLSDRIYQGFSSYPSYPVGLGYHHFSPTVDWRMGRWSHSWHENRFGWWWVNGLNWSFYSAPSYPYPEPVQNRTTIIYQAAPEPEPAAIPPVAVAPVLRIAPPTPMPGSQEPPRGNGLYYFCESSQLYYPYARTCSERWKTVPQAPVD